VATLQRRLAAISRQHRLAGERVDTKHPAIRDVWSGIKRTLGTAAKKKAAILPATLRDILDRLPAALIGTRDRAILLLGFAAALRRSKLVALDIEDMEIGPLGAAITIRRSKTDQEGAGHVLGVPPGRIDATCPVRALEAWRASPGESASGPLFRSIDRHGRIGAGEAVAIVVKRAAARVGLDTAKFAGHSLRSGFATTAAANGADLVSIMEQTRHRSDPDRQVGGVGIDIATENGLGTDAISRTSLLRIALAKAGKSSAMTTKEPSPPITFSR
jgi:integrase